jgi:hypothetical protein
MFNYRSDQNILVVKSFALVCSFEIRAKFLRDNILPDSILKPHDRQQQALLRQAEPKQCCGSWMFIQDPRSRILDIASRIPDLGFRISDPRSRI